MMNMMMDALNSIAFSLKSSDERAKNDAVRRKREEKDRLMPKTQLSFQKISLRSGADFMNGVLQYEDELERGQIRSGFRIYNEF
jgi:hypothetical protein